MVVLIGLVVEAVVAVVVVVAIAEVSVAVWQ